MTSDDPSPLPIRLDLDRYFPFFLTALANKMTSGASRTYRKSFGIGVTEWRAMSMMGLEPGVTLNRICQVTGIDKSSVSRAIAVLEKRGCVRISPDERGNRWRLWLTPAGETLHNQVIDVALRREEQLLSGFSPAEREQLISYFKRLVGNIGRANEVEP